MPRPSVCIHGSCLENLTVALIERAKEVFGAKVVVLADACQVDVGGDFVLAFSPEPSDQPEVANISCDELLQHLEIEV